MAKQISPVSKLLRTVILVVLALAAFYLIGQFLLTDDAPDTQVEEVQPITPAPIE